MKSVSLHLSKKKKNLTSRLTSYYSSSKQKTAYSHVQVSNSSQAWGPSALISPWFIQDGSLNDPPYPGLLPTAGPFEGAMPNSREKKVSNITTDAQRKQCKFWITKSNFYIMKSLSLFWLTAVTVY